MEFSFLKTPTVNIRKIIKQLQNYIILRIVLYRTVWNRFFLFERIDINVKIDPNKEIAVSLVSCFNYFEYTKRFIDSYYSSIDDKYNYILMIMDDHSEDMTKAFFLSRTKAYNNMCYFRYKKNMGVSQTWNDGILFALRKLKANYIFLCNSDTIISKNAIGTLIGHLKNNRQIGVIGPLTNCPGHQSHQNIRRYCPGYVASDLLNDIQKIHNFVKDNKPIEISYVNGFFMGFPKKALEENVYFTFIKLYYFNPLYRDKGNEDDFQERLKQIGLKSFIATDVFVFHYKDITLGRITDPNDMHDKLIKGQIFRRN